MKLDPRAIVPTSLAKRLTQAVTYGLTGGFFSPQLPLQPQHPETAGRRFDYLAGYNISTRPRRDSGIEFQMLRNFAKYYDLLRILIEKRKDQITNFEWSIVPTDEATDAGGKGTLEKLTQSAAAVQKFLKYPDGRQKWNTWLRAIIEDMLVLDAITIWPTYQGNKIIRLDTVDPATIKLVIDESGRTPEPPFPAYQQVLHGIPTANFLKDELLYYMSNPASDRIYGLSKVEQILITIQIGLRREASQLQFFTDGNVPAALAGVPETWNPQQIAALQNAFDSMLAGDTANRRRIWFVPGETAKNIKEFKSEEATLKATFDEWIMRIMCFTFGIAPTPFTNQVNRATAFSAQEEARDEGLGPQLTFIKGVMDSVIANALKVDGVEFKWAEDAENDPASQATIDDTMVRNGSRSIDELRQRDGLEPLGIGPMIYLGTGTVMIQDIIDGKTQGPMAIPPDPVADPTKPAAAAATGAAAKKPVKTTPDGKHVSANDHNTDAPLSAANKVEGGLSGKLRPFRKSKVFGYASHAVYSPKSAAAQARLVKASRDFSAANKQRHLEKAKRDT